MKQSLFEIKDNIRIAKNTYKMVLCGDISEIKRPGTFVNIKLEGKFLRRPISVCDVSGDELTIVYKTVGEGTRMMSGMEGGTLDILTGLGNGYDPSKSGDRPLLLGGGVGVPPLYLLAKRLSEQGRQVTAVLGFNTADEVFYAEEFKKYCTRVIIVTADGSMGEKGFVTSVLDGLDYSYFYTCGPEPMLKAVYNTTCTSGQFSFEERMGCGFGACMGCSCKTLYGNKRICVDGPVLEKEEIIWEAQK